MVGEIVGFLESIELLVVVCFIFLVEWWYCTLGSLRLVISLLQVTLYSYANGYMLNT